MLYLNGVAGLILLGLWIYCIFDVITTDTAFIRNLPKFLWLLIVVVMPAIGSIAWLVAGRPDGASFRIGESSSGYRPPRRPLGPEDRSDFSPIVRERDELAELRMREEQLRRREEEVRRRELAAGIDDGPPAPPPPSSPNDD